MSKRKQKAAKTGEIDARALFKRLDVAPLDTITRRDLLDLAEALRERLPFDTLEVVGDFREEHQGQAAEEVADLCNLVRGLWERLAHVEDSGADVEPVGGGE